MGDITAMADVVWPAEEAEELSRRSLALAELVEHQLPVRREAGTHACDGWSGGYRQLFDATHDANQANGAELAANLRAIADALGRAGAWVRDENAARSSARDREADDATWGGLKRHYNALVGQS